MDVQILSLERVKPSSPTPNHLRNHKLCLLDQLFPVAYAPIVFFYSYTSYRVLEKISELKKSLSETLSRFFPLAGTIIDDLSIDCDDQGASFTTAKVDCRLNDYLGNPNLELIAKFLPSEITTTGLLLPVTNIQASVFECGGIAIGVYVSHKVLDGTALSTFLKSWASVANSRLWGSLFKKGRFITKRFVFEEPAIASLKKMANGLSGPGPVTRVGVVSGFIWKCAIAAFEERFGLKKPSLLTHVVNLRRRASPNFSEHSLGNLVWVASAKMKAHFKEIENFVRCEDHVHGFSITSWCNLGLYDVDFGWGKPVWVTSIDASGPFFMNLAILVDMRYGDGIEAWVTLDEQEMDILEHNQEFATFAFLNP
ncbi:hypothetical protein MIMGU_mgv1a025046mg, partial [Erythranthe guttata]